MILLISNTEKLRNRTKEILREKIKIIQRRNT
jgi:hypothetical protein